MATIIPVVTASLDLFRIQDSIRQAQESIEGSMRFVREALAHYDRTMLSLVDEAREHGRSGWTIPMLFAVHTVPAVLANLGEIGDLDDLFAEYYGKEDNVSLLFSDLLQMESLERWRPLLTESVDSFLAGRFLVVVPSLFLIFEGVFALATKMFERKINIERFSAKQLDLGDCGQDQAVWGSLEGFGGELFRSRNFAETAPIRLNRHWILHGRAATTWSRLDCLRLFQAIHTAGSQSGY